MNRLNHHNRNFSSRHPLSQFCRWPRGSGFSLVEMLVVVSVIGLIAAATAPMLFATMKANRLSAAGEEISNRIALAQQFAVSRNHEVELRFYHYSDPEDPKTRDHYRATLIVEPAADPNAPGAVQTTVLSEMSYLRNGIVVAHSSVLSPTLEDVNDQGDSEGRIRAASASYRSIRFSPDGTCDVKLRPEDAYLTIVEERDLAAQGEVPKNFFAVQIDHYTSRITTFRP